MSSYNYADERCAAFHGPVPVFANADGDSPEGLRNMAGNMAEWVFDWYSSDGYEQLSSLDPVGAGCDLEELPYRRVTRGQAYTSTAVGLRTLTRNPLFDTARASVVGFRCARSLTEGGQLCDPRMPEVIAACHPGADIRQESPGQVPPLPCPGPDFSAASSQELLGCPGTREGSGRCQRRSDQPCLPTGESLGCHSFLLSRFKLPENLFSSVEYIGIFNSVLNLGPQGGSTLLAIELPEGFGLEVARPWPATFGSAQINAEGHLAWSSIMEEGICRPAELMSFQLETYRNQRELQPVCGALGEGRLWFRSAPVSMAFSGLALTASYDPVSAKLSGMMVLIANIRDIQQSTFGNSVGDELGGTMEALFNHSDIPVTDLCGVRPLSLLEPSCNANPLFPPGCGLEACEDPELCQGYLLPLEYEAIRADRAGVLGLSACQ